MKIIRNTIIGFLVFATVVLIAATFAYGITEFAQFLKDTVGEQQMRNVFVIGFFVLVIPIVSYFIGEEIFDD